jgi:hypothetical protein
VLCESNEFTPDYRLSDSVDLSIANANILALEVSSDNPSHYKNFSKRVQEAGARGLFYVMPIFTFEEQLRILPSDISRDEAHFLYDVFGGSARYTRKWKFSAGHNDDIVVNSMKWFFSDSYKDVNIGNAWNYAVGVLSVRVNDASDISINSTMKHLVATNKYIWASKYIEVLAGMIINERNNDMSSKLKAIFDSSGMGNAFESFGHKKLTQSCVNYILRPLMNTRPKKLSTSVISINFKLPIMLIRCVGDIGTLNQGFYGLPTISNFPLIDAVIQPNILLQFTVSPDKHKGASNKLNEIRSHLNEKNFSKHMMVFIIPYENRDSFKFQQDLSDIKQYITFDDPVSNLSTLGPTKKKAKY